MVNRLLVLAACLFVLIPLGPTSPASAQNTDFVLKGRPVTAYPLPEKAHAKGGPYWEEDLDKVTEGAHLSGTTIQYMDALRATGMMDHLSSASMADPTDRDAWTLKGPIGATGAEPRNGRIAAMQILQPTGSPITVYAGSCQGGLWKSQDSDADGGIWQDISTTLPNPSVRGFAVDPGNDQHLIVGTGDYHRYEGSGLFETFDGGVTWNPRSPPSDALHYFRIFFLDRPSNPANQHVIAASDQGLFLSHDGGSTWSYALINDQFGTFSSSGIWYDLVIDPASPSVMYATVNRYNTTDNINGVYKSVDYGETWVQLPDAILPQNGLWGRTAMAICHDYPENLAIFVTSNNICQGIFKSTDSGENWTDISGTVYNWGNGQNAHAQSIAIRPSDPDQIFLGSIGLAMTVDGGASWLIGADSGIHWGHDDITHLYFSEFISRDLLWICNDGGIYFRSLLGSTTSSYIGGPVHGLACSEIDEMDADRQWRAIGLQDNGVWFSDDDGENWMAQAGGDGADVEIYDVVHGDYMYNSGVYPAPRKWVTFRKPNGAGATDTNNPHPADTPRLSYMADRGLMVTHNEKGIYTTDAETGTSWDLLANGLQTGDYFIRDLAVSSTGDGAIYVGFWDTNPRDVTIVRMVDGGAPVITHSRGIGESGQYLRRMVVSREWPGESWVTLKGEPGQPKIMHTTDYGQTWEDLTANLAAVPVVDTIEVTPFNSHILYAGTNIGMFRSENGGKSWQPFQEGLPIGRCKELRFVIDPFGENHTLELAMDGRGLWTRPMTLPRVLFVDGESTLAEAGTREHPYHTIQMAIQNAQNGAIIAVRSGTYYEPYTLAGDLMVVAWGGPVVVR